MQTATQIAMQTLERFHVDAVCLVDPGTQRFHIAEHEIRSFHDLNQVSAKVAHVFFGPRELVIKNCISPGLPKTRQEAHSIDYKMPGFLIPAK